MYQGACRNLTAAEVARRTFERPPATRVRVPDESDPASTVRFCDLVRGPQEENLARECGDFLVRRSDGVVAYQLAVVVDDGLMQSISDFFTWLFNDRTGVICLVLAGVAICLIISFVLERRMRKQYYNHKKSENDWDLFDSDDESDSDEGDE